MEIYGADVTYQYSDTGEKDSTLGGGHIAHVSPETICCADDLRNAWQASFKTQWAGSSYEKRVLSDLQRILSEQLKQLPDNPFVQREAYLAGITDNGGEYIDGWVRLARRLVTEEEEEKAKLAEEMRVREEARKGIKKHEYHVEDIEDEGGKTCCVHHIITVDDNTVLAFNERNIFDFGRVINPEYPVVDGAEPGGLISFDSKTGTYYFMDFRAATWKVGDKIGECDMVEKEYHSWVLPAGYALRKTARQGFFELEDWYEVIDTETGRRVGDDGTLSCLPACGGTPEAALRDAFWELEVTPVDGGGWYKTRDLTPQEEAACKYLWHCGYYVAAGIRMEHEGSS